MYWDAKIYKEDKELFFLSHDRIIWYCTGLLIQALGHPGPNPGRGVNLLVQCHSALNHIRKE
jgi:hypothetical protein